MKEAVRYLPWAGIFVFTFLLAIAVHRKFCEENVWERIVKRYRSRVDAKILSEAAFVTKYGSVENHSLLYRLDRLMLTSGIKNRIPWVNGEVFLLAVFAAAVFGLFAGTALFSNVFAGIFTAAAQAAVLYGAALAMSGKVYNQIEDGTAIFVSILSNHAKGSSDIVTIMQNTIPSLSGPLKRITEKFVSDSENTGNIDGAFDYMKESVDNRQLQTIIVNLKNCMHYQANYEEVLAQMMGQVVSGLSAREDRKNILFSMKMTLTVISIMAVVIVLIIGAGLDIDVAGSLTGNKIGQVLLLVTGLLYLMVGIKMFKTDK